MSDLSIYWLNLFTSFLESHGKRRVSFIARLNQDQRELYIKWSELSPEERHHEVLEEDQDQEKDQDQARELEDRDQKKELELELDLERDVEEDVKRDLVRDLDLDLDLDQEDEEGQEQDLTRTSSTPEEGQWSLRIQICEDGLSKASKFIEELLEQTENQQEEMRLQGDKIVELIELLKQTESQLEVVQLQLHQDEGGSQLVTFKDLQEALLRERENVKPDRLPLTSDASSNEDTTSRITDLERKYNLLSERYEQQSTDKEATAGPRVTELLANTQKDVVKIQAELDKLRLQIERARHPVTTDVPTTVQDESPSQEVADCSPETIELLDNMQKEVVKVQTELDKLHIQIESSISLQQISSTEDRAVANRITDLERKYSLLSERCEQQQDTSTNMQQQIMEVLKTLQEIPQTQTEQEGSQSNIGEENSKLLAIMQKDVLRIQEELDKLRLQVESFLSLQDANSNEDMANRITDLERKYSLLSQRYEQLQDTSNNMQQQAEDRKAEINSQILEVFRTMQRDMAENQTEQEGMLNHFEEEMKSLSEQVDKLSTDVQHKLNRTELVPVKNQLMKCYRSLREELQALGTPNVQDAALTQRQIVPRFSDTSQCLSCGSIAKLTFGLKPSSLPCAPGFPKRQTTGPFRAYARHCLRPQRQTGHPVPGPSGGDTLVVVNEHMNNQKESPKIQSHMKSTINIQECLGSGNELQLTLSKIKDKPQTSVKHPVH